MHAGITPFFGFLGCSQVRGCALRIVLPPQFTEELKHLKSNRFLFAGVFPSDADAIVIVNKPIASTLHFTTHLGPSSSSKNGDERVGRSAPSSRRSILRDYLGSRDCGCGRLIPVLGNCFQTKPFEM